MASAVSIVDVVKHFGSLQALGMRALPLVQFHLSRWLSIDGYFALQMNLRSGELRYNFALGATLLAF